MKRHSKTCSHVPLFPEFCKRGTFVKITDLSQILLIALLLLAVVLVQEVKMS